MKKNDFMTKIKNEIDSQNQKLTDANTEISTTNAKIEKLTQEIAAYSDYENVDKFAELKADKARLEAKVELMSRQLNALRTSANDTIMDNLNAFNSEKLAIYKQYNDKIIDVTKQIETIYADAISEIDSLKNLYSAYTTAFNVSPQQAAQVPINNFLDDSGILYAARGFLQKFEQIRSLTGK